jgi:hypothetical protein
MKSPSSSVGIIESEGIRNGSNKKDRITSTMRITGKKDLAYSALNGWVSTGSSSPLPSEAASARRRGRSHNESTSQMNPVSAVASTSTRLKSSALRFASVRTVSTPRISSTQRSARMPCGAT